MSEKHVGHAEHGQEANIASNEVKAKSQELLEKARHEAAEAKNLHQEQIDELRNEIEKQAATSQEMAKAESSESSEPEAANTYWYSAEYRKQAYDQMLKNVRKHLPARDRLASKVFHQPTVERVSEIGSRTIARPSGVLVGSILSFVTSFIVYFFSKRYGYDMTYSVFIVSFLGGFLLGIIGEFGIRAIRTVLSRQ